MRGWQKHHGKGIPATIAGVKVMLRLANGETRGPARADLYGGWHWPVLGVSGNFYIHQYRVARKQDF